MKFEALDLAPEIMRAVKACGYSSLTPIQQKAIVAVRRGRDVLANAQTGTGKTAAFTLPVLQQMADRPAEVKPGAVRTLVLTPTRELAMQLTETISNYAQYLPFTVISAYGGSSLEGQAKKIQRGADILVATPARLIEHITACNINLSQVEFLVLDEADRMLDMGFVKDVMNIRQKLTAKPQTLLFSATASGMLNELSAKMLKNPVEIMVNRRNSTADTVEHVVYPVEESRKPELFAELLEKHNWFQVLVFTKTKAQADDLVQELKFDGIKAMVCHGDKSQGSRRRAIEQFKDGKAQVLIATEVAARGLDIEGLEYVVNYNLPFLAEDYVHRIGRAGRAGKKGYAISFVSREEERSLLVIEKLIGSTIKRKFMRGYEVSDRDGLRKRIVKKKPAPRMNKSTKERVAKKIQKTASRGKKK
ncbi:DEAD/DEAH box helicase [Marinobacterium jannaschii]|uniref:DEAD/DEAH box helicase n=1 Tax=Marinobacterium jannaschii TaxID=64970 RepID=UPI0004821B21|nr:DEAD/DEAH box helicase [Marinobacterium jannaschii]